MKYLWFIPKERERAASWFQNFKTVLPLHALALKLDPERIVEITVIVDGLIDANTELVAARKKYESARDNYNQKFSEISTVQGGLSNFISEIKSKTGYNLAIGAELGIIGHCVEIDYSAFIPVLKVRTIGNELVELRFKRHYADEVAIYSRRGEEESFSPLSSVKLSPYIDTRSNIVKGVPEERQYMIVLVKDDREVSQPSGIMKIKI